MAIRRHCMFVALFAVCSLISACGDRAVAPGQIKPEATSTKTDGDKKPEVSQRPQPPYEILEPLTDAKPILARLAGRAQDVWLDGDVLHFAYIAKEGPIQAVGGVQEELARVADSDLWLLRLKWSGWSKAIVGYSFFGPQMGHNPHFDVWRGDDAPQLPKYADTLGRVEQLEIDSKFLGEKRSVTVILPPGAERDIPAIVMADGQSAETWGKVIRTLIDEGRMRPTAIVGIHNGGYRGDRSKGFDPQMDYRAREYLEKMDIERFGNHLRWVTDEVLPTVAQKFGISTRREDLAVGGFSNGGSFAAAAALRRPDVFGASFAFSVGVAPEGERPKGPLPKFYFESGELEPSFLRTTRQTMEMVRAWGAETQMQAYCAGHDNIAWDIACATYAPQFFPPKGK